MTQYSSSPKTFNAGEALEAFRRVRYDGADVVYADAGEIGIGATLEIAAHDGSTAVQLDNQSGSMKVMASAAFAAGDELFPAADGKVSSIPTGPSVGIALEAATAAGDIIEMVPQLSHMDWLNKIFATKAANYSTLITDGGNVILVNTDAVVITLVIGTTALAGYEITIVNIGTSAAVEITIDPDAADLIAGGCGIAATADGVAKVNTKATAKKGDFMKLVFNGTTGWNIVGVKGTWA